MFNFGPSSEKKLSSVDPELVEVPRLVISWGVYDFTIVWGFRTNAEQMQAFLTGGSKKQSGSYHQVTKDGRPFAQAIDFAPWCFVPKLDAMGIPWDDTHAFAVLGGMMIAAGQQLGIEIVYGGDWDMDGMTTDQLLMDWGHIQKANPLIST